MKLEDPLFEWSRITNEEMVHSLVAHCYIDILTRVPANEAFITWLLAGTAATSAVLLSNLPGLKETIGASGVQWLFVLLVLSILFGLMAKFATFLLPSNTDATLKSQTRFRELLAAHKEVREKIEGHAKAQGKATPEDFRLEDFVSELIRPFPWWAKISIASKLNRLIKNKERHGDLHMALTGWRMQILLGAAQALLAIAALVSIPVRLFFQSNL